MKIKELGIYEKLLLERKKKLLTQALGKSGKSREEQAADPIDVASKAAALEMMSALEQNEQRELEEINLALEKIRQGTYGRCEDCSQEIAPARLEAIPTARLCRDCKARQERTYSSPPKLRASIDDGLRVFADNDEDRQEHQ